MKEVHNLQLTLVPASLSAFYPLIQQGLWLNVQTGCSITSLLTDQLGITLSYLNERITTLFLDGKAIDNPENAYLQEGSTLALSSAMPGLVGTTMRRGGHLAAMRDAITYQSQQPATIGNGRIRIKLFNMIMAEMGAALLHYGIWLPRQKLNIPFACQNDSFWHTIKAATLGGQPVSITELQNHLQATDDTQEFFLRVIFAE